MKFDPNYVSEWIHDVLYFSSSLSLQVGSYYITSLSFILI